MTAALRALPFVFMMTTGSTYAFGQRVTCYPIRPGDTAARLAQRFTGSAYNRHQAWFQIVDPTTETSIPKSHYGVIQSGWHVCMATERLTGGSAQPRYYVVSSAPVFWQAGVAQKRTAIDLSILWRATPIVAAVAGLALAWVVSAKYIGRRRTSLDIMSAFGDTFISEFERPLFRRCPADSPIRSRLRRAPARHRLEIFLAPADGRTYPNLFDHRRNVEYDVERVLRLLSNEPFPSRFVCGPLRAEGPWVVIPFRFEP